METLNKILKKDSVLKDLSKKEFKNYFSVGSNIDDLTKKLDREEREEIKKLIKNKKQFNKFINDKYDNNKKSKDIVFEKPFKSYNRGIQYETTAACQRFQADLADMTFLKKHKIPLRQYNWVLVIVDLFSTKVWYIAVTKKNKKIMARVLEKFFRDLKFTFNHNEHIWLQVDKGGEFYNSEVKKVMENNNITLYSTKGKAFIAEQRIFLLKRYFKDNLVKDKSSFLKKKKKRHINWWSVLPTIQNKVNRLKSSRLHETPENLWNSGKRNDKLLFNKNKTVTKALESEYSRNLKEKTNIKSNAEGLNMEVDENSTVLLKNTERDDENKINRFTKSTTNVDGEWSKSKYIVSNKLINTGQIGPPVLYQLRDNNGSLLEGLFTREDFYNTTKDDRIRTKRDKDIQIERYQND